MLTPIQHLKIDMMTHGLTVGGSARRQLQGQSGRPLTLADYASTSGVSMRLDGDVWINAPIVDFNPNFVSRPAAELVWEADRFLVRSGKVEVMAEPLPVPAYHDQVDPDGDRYTSYAITHTDRVRISPIEGCAVACQFCDLPHKYVYRTKKIEGLVGSVARALTDTVLPAHHVLISGGTPRPLDYGYVNAVYEQVCLAFPSVDVDVMMVPMPGLLDLARLKAVGVHGLSINLELFNEQRARFAMAGKAKVSRQSMLDFIEEAVVVFGAGHVRSLILIGLEEPEDTLRAVRCLAERGCDPVLSPFRPDPSTPFRSLSPPSAELLAELYQDARDIVSQYPAVRLGPRCVPCQHNTLAFPEDVVPCCSRTH